MFEEDFERCFICQTPCKGLYCSSECRLQDGKPKAAAPNINAPVRLTAQLPPSLSPHVRPVHNITPSPRMPGQAVDTSSSSSRSSSPFNSPRTVPSATDSPQKETFNLPPPAYPQQSLAFSSSMAVRIPVVAPKPVPVLGSSSSHQFGSSLLQGGSIETLRFGRKSSVTNSITSPNALLPRCACGKPANHRSRPHSKDRSTGEMDNGFARLNLGPAVTSHQHHHPHGSAFPHSQVSDKRHVSDSTVHGIAIERKAGSGYASPQLGGHGGSLLSRSRSDPMPPSPKQSRHGAIAPTTVGRQASIITPSRRASAAAEDRAQPTYSPMSRTSSAQQQSHSGQLSPAASSVTEMRRGRSRDRQRYPAEIVPSGLLNHPTEREHPPSRSRARRDEPRRSHEGLKRASPGGPGGSARGIASPLPPISPSIFALNQPAQAMPSSFEVRQDGQARPATVGSNGQSRVAA